MNPPLKVVCTQPSPPPKGGVEGRVGPLMRTVTK